ncbi:glycosyltransferase family protein [Neoroseomonas lacus]|uniref:Glycosyltransferase n=1 Tax=Neoroseomonas lacus TaxID=287609 RepID=A0A917NZK2_9PROT|nr:glycosyl transferase family 1 [Neoroseomonas lacus]GGJ44254.1 hypothetical protein GCM10011320_59680 [Neoroseomonas lacus]
MLDIPADDFAPLLQEMRVFGEARLVENAACFGRIVEHAEQLVGQGRYDEACVQVFIAAFHAVARHSGVWASPKLESLLTRIAQQTLTDLPGRRAPAEIRHVMHVTTQIPTVGGLARMMERWIRTDAGRMHSVVVTRQSTMPLPDSIREAVAQRHGGLRILDHGRGALIERAQRLRDIAQEADLVVLHTHPFDIVPQLAFATPNRPPVAFLDHADHGFWLGTHITDVMASMREAGKRIMIERRSIPPERIALLPTILAEPRRKVSRQEAKRRIGVPEDSVLLLSVARARKYVTVGGMSFADLHVPTLLDHPKAILLTVGPGKRDDWTDAAQRCGGRIVSLPEHDDPSLFFEAADIYVDSFPFVSITSTLEAAGLGTPAVSLFPFGTTSEVLGCNMPGLDGLLVTCTSRGAYEAALSRLITDEAHRHALGQELPRQIAAHHLRDAWLGKLEVLYAHAVTAPRHLGAGGPVLHFDGAPDVFIQAIHGGNPDGEGDRDRLLKYELGVLKFPARLREWRRLRTLGLLKGSGRYGPLIYLLPEWLKVAVSRWRRRKHQ